jgi:hypothetical protein
MIEVDGFPGTGTGDAASTVLVVSGPGTVLVTSGPGTLLVTVTGAAAAAGLRSELVAGPRETLPMMTPKTSAKSATTGQIQRCACFVRSSEPDGNSDLTTLGGVKRLASGDVTGALKAVVTAAAEGVGPAAFA